MQGGPFGHCLDRNELLLKRAWRSNDLARLVATMANYTSRSSFTNCLTHFKGKEVSRFSKQPANCPPSTDNDFHYLNCVNFSHSRITIPVTESNIMDDVHMQQPPSSSNKLLPFGI